MTGPGPHLFATELQADNLPLLSIEVSFKLGASSGVWSPNLHQRRQLLACNAVYFTRAAMTRFCSASDNPTEQGRLSA